MLFRAERGFFMKLETLVKEFLFECEIREYSGMTVENYRKQIKHFTDFLKEQFEILCAITESDKLLLPRNRITEHMQRMCFYFR